MRAWLAGLALAMLACSGAPDSGPVELTWDRDACAHCYMTIGDRHAAAQLRLEAGGDAHLSDDLGCALLFAEARASDPEAPREIAEIWVRDARGEGGQPWKPHCRAGRRHGYRMRSVERTRARRNRFPPDVPG